MAVVLDHPLDDEGAAPIRGRPDFYDHKFGVTLAKRHPAYVFSIRAGSCLVHKIVRVELHWWRVANNGHALVKLKRPAMFAITNCQMFFGLEGSRSRACHVPSPDALLCGRCQGVVATFGKDGPGTKAGIKRSEAHVKLGCAVVGY